MLADPLRKFRFHLRGTSLHELFSSHLLFSTPFSTPEKEGGTFTTTDKLPISNITATKDTSLTIRSKQNHCIREVKSYTQVKQPWRPHSTCKPLAHSFPL
jgi:hypothetical protein